MAEKKEIVVVTGSSGCLGQHIVKLLQEKDDKVGEIRLFDLVPYKNNLDHAENKPMKEIVGDVRELSSLIKAFEGSSCVIHAAAVTDFSLNPDTKKMRSVNVDGTKNVIEACIKQNVPHLVFASSTDVVVGTEHVFYGTESTTPIPDTFMIGPYGETKCEAEKIVLKASGKLLADGKTKLRTAAIRSTPFFGEEDKHLIYSALQFTKKHDGYYRRVRSLDERLQICYVGNAAWAHVKAKDKLSVDESISGEAFFVTDDTPIIDIHEQFRPFMEARGFTLSSYILPYWLVWIFLSLFCLILNAINCVVTLSVDVPSVNQLNYLCSTFFYNRAKATLRLDYQPIYTPETATERSMEYYVKVPL